MGNSSDHTGANFHFHFHFHFHIETELLILVSTTQLMHLNNLINSNNYATIESEF